MAGSRSWQSSLSIMPLTSDSGQELYRDFSSTPASATSSAVGTSSSENGVSLSTTALGTSISTTALGTSIKFPDPSMSSSSSEEDNDISPTADTEENSRKSPPPNCAICLGRCKNKCFTDSCMHQFCFKCLCEWSKVKPECPLCKQIFKAIIHNVKSMDQFEEYLVQPPVQQRQEHSLQWRLQSGYTSARFDLFFEEMIMNHATIQALTNEARPRLSFRTGSSTSVEPIAGSNSSAVNYRSELLNLHGDELSDSVNSNYLSRLWRRYIYDRKLFALPVCDVTGRFRESSSRFYRDNPAQMQRLMPWINRDMRCLLRNNEHSVSNILDLISDALKLCNILSPAFRRRLQPFLGQRTSHFIHELNNFARSPYDMIGYDRVVQYSPQSTEEIFIDYSSSSSTESGVNVDAVTVNVDDSDNGSGRVNTPRQISSIESSERNNTTSNSAGLIQPMNIMSFAVSSTSEGTETTTITSAPVLQRLAVITPPTLQGGAINLSTHNRQSDSNDVYGFLNIELFSDDERQVNLPDSNSVLLPAPTPRAPIDNNDPVILSLSSSDSDCEFVLEQKPPHLRTPELVSLNSESDSDVVFVNETVSREISTNIPNRETQNTNRCSRRRHACTLTSTSDSDESNNKKTGNHLRSTKKLKLYENKMTTKPVLDEQYNVGASTSKGLKKNCSTGKKSNRSFDKRRRFMRLKRKISNSKNSLAKQHRRCKHSSEESRIYFEESTNDNNDDTSDEDQPLIRFCRYQPKNITNRSTALQKSEPIEGSKSQHSRKAKRSNKVEICSQDFCPTEMLNVECPSPPATQHDEIHLETEQNSSMSTSNYLTKSQNGETEVALCNNNEVETSSENFRVCTKFEENPRLNFHPKTDLDSQERNQCIFESTDSETSTTTNTDSDSSSFSSISNEYKKEDKTSFSMSSQSSQNFSPMASQNLNNHNTTSNAMAEETDSD